MKSILSSSLKVICQIKKIFQANKSQETDGFLWQEQSKVFPARENSVESIDSGFVESIPESISSSESNYSTKSILRQHHSVVGDRKKKVSINAPESPVCSQKPRKRIRMRAQKIISQSCSEESVNDVALSGSKLNISSQITCIIDAAKQYLLHQHPHLADSLQILFINNAENQLSSLSPQQIAKLLHSLKMILFSPPDQYQDIIITRVMQLLITVSKILHLDDLLEECEHVSRECYSSNFYQDPDNYWRQVQTCLISVWCRILVL